MNRKDFIKRIALASSALLGVGWLFNESKELEYIRPYRKNGKTKLQMANQEFDLYVNREKIGITKSAQYQVAQGSWNRIWD